MDCLDIDGPERYKSGCVYASCPTCVIPVGPKHFMEPLKPERSRRAEEIIRFYRDDDGESKNKTLIKWKEKLAMRPVFNCMWERKCIPTEPYFIVTTDILHGIIHGILANIIDNQKEVFSRNKISKQNISIMNCQKEEFKHYSSPSFDIKVGSEEAVYLPFNLTS